MPPNADTESTNFFNVEGGPLTVKEREVMALIYASSDDGMVYFQVSAKIFQRCGFSSYVVRMDFLKCVLHCILAQTRKNGRPALLTCGPLLQQVS